MPRPCPFDEREFNLVINRPWHFWPGPILFWCETQIWRGYCHSAGRTNKEAASALIQRHPEVTRTQRIDRVGRYDRLSTGASDEEALTSFAARLGSHSGARKLSLFMYATTLMYRREISNVWFPAPREGWQSTSVRMCRRVESLFLGPSDIRRASTKN